MDELSKSSLALLVVGVMVISIAGTILVLNAVDMAAGAATSTAQGFVYLVVNKNPNAPAGPTPVPVSQGAAVGAVVS